MGEDVNEETVYAWDKEQDNDAVYYQSSGVYVHSTDSATDQCDNYQSTDGAAQPELECEGFCVLSSPTPGRPTDEPKKSKGPTKWNNVLRRHLGKKGRKKEQTDDSKKSIAGVISGSIQKLFGKSSNDEKEKHPDSANGFDSNSTTVDDMHSDQQPNDFEDEEDADSDEMMWSDNEFDEDDIYANADEFSEEDHRPKDEMEEGREVRKTQSIQATGQSTQISTQTTQVQMTQMVTTLSRTNVELDQVTTCPTQSKSEGHLADDSRPNYESIDFRNYMISDEKTDEEARSQNGDYNVNNSDPKSECADICESADNDLVLSESRDSDKTTLNDSTAKRASDNNSSSVKFNVPLKSLNKTTVDTAVGNTNSKQTRAECDRNAARSVLQQDNGEPTDYNWRNRLKKQEPNAGRGLSSDAIHHNWITAKPANACVTKGDVIDPSLTCITKTNAKCVTKPTVISDNTQSVECVTYPTAPTVIKTSITSVTKACPSSVVKPNDIGVKGRGLVNTAKPGVTCITKPNFNCVIAKPSTTCSSTHASVPGFTKPSVASATTKSSATGLTKPNVTSPTTKPSVVVLAKPGAAMKSNVTVLTQPNITVLTKTNVTSATTKPSVTVVTKPSVTCAATKPSITVLAKPNATCATPKPSVTSSPIDTSVTSASTKPNVTVLTKPNVTCAATRPSVIVHTRQSVTCATTKPSFTIFTEPSITCAVKTPSVTSSATTKSSVTWAAAKLNVNCSTPTSVNAPTKPGGTSAPIDTSINCATKNSTPPNVTVSKKPSLFSATIEPSVTCAATKVSVNYSTAKQGVSYSTPTNVTSPTEPDVTSVTRKPGFISASIKPRITSSTTKLDVASLTKPNVVVVCAENPLAFSTKERAAMFGSLGAKKIDFHGRDRKELDRITSQAYDKTQTSGLSKTDTGRTMQNPNIFKMMSRFESNKHPEKSSHQTRSNTGATGLQDTDNGSNDGANAARSAALKKSKPMSDQRTFTSTKETSKPPPLPARKWSGSSGGSSGSTVPGKGGIAFRDGEPPDVPPVLSSRRRPSQKENDSSTDFYLASTDSTSSTEAGKKADNDGEDVVVAYIDQFEFRSTTATSAKPVKAKSQPLPPLPNSHPSKPKTSTSGTQTGTSRAVYVSAEEIPEEQSEDAETKISGGRSSVPTIPSVPKPPASSITATGRSSVPAIPSVPKTPASSIKGASIVIGKAAIATDSCSNELEEVRKNLGKKPGWSSSERDEQFASGLNSKPPLLPTARTSASERGKKLKPPPALPSEYNTNVTDEITATLEQNSWYHGDISRKECEALILSETQNGRFAVRRRCDDADGNPYALSIQHNNRMHNVLIRRRPDNTFALGNEKTHENIFNDVMELVNFHRNNAISLSNNVKVKLTSSPSRR